MSIHAFFSRSFLTPSRVVALLLTGGSVACVALTDGTLTQCRNEEDCRSRGPEWADTTCTVDRVCAKLTETQIGCTTNQECSDKNGGAPFICKKSNRQCVPITTPECTQLLGEKPDWLSSDAIFIGISSVPNIDGTLVQSGADLARAEIRDALRGGLPPVTAGGPPRPLVVLNCPNEPLPNIGFFADTERGVRHMVDDLEIKTYFPFLPQVFTSIIPKVTIPANVLTFTIPSGTPVIVGDYPGNLTYQMGGTDIDTGKLLLKMMTDKIEPRVLADPSFAPVVAGEIKVQQVFAQDAANGNSANFILQNLKWNGGKSTADNQAAGFYKATSLGDTNDKLTNPAIAARTTQAIAEVIAFKPHVLVVSLAPAFVNSFLIPLETQWPAGTPRPLIVSTLTSWTNVIVGGIGSRDSLRRRYIGLETTAKGFDQEHFNAFQIALRVRFPELQNQNIGISTYYVYDAIYALAYSIVAAGTTELKGDVISRGIRRLSNGPTVKTGPEELPKGFAALANDGTISLQGISGPVSFNEKGERPGLARVYCVTASGGVANGLARPGYQMDIATQTVSGVSDCP
jgi:hypothetical protein